MFKRKIYDEILKWKNSINHKPLIISGLRQIGKTTIVENFAKENYESVIKLDFRKDAAFMKFLMVILILTQLFFPYLCKIKIISLIQIKHVCTNILIQHKDVEIKYISLEKSRLFFYSLLEMVV